PAAPERFEVLTRQPRGHRLLAAVHVERAAAHLLPRNVDLAAVVAQHAQRGPVDAPVYERHDTAGEHPDPMPHFSDGWIDIELRDERWFQRWQQLLGVFEWRRPRQRANQPLRSRALVRQERSEHGSQPSRM